MKGASDLKKYTATDNETYVLIENENGATLGLAKDSAVEILESDGFAFKDLNKNGRLDPYEDWRLPMEERIADLVSQLPIEEIAGLMLYSGHQSVATTGRFAEMFAGTYDGLPLAENNQAKISDITDQQKTFLKEDRLRHVLLTAVEDTEAAVTWNNQMQAFVENLDFGIPINMSSDPRHTSEANTEFNAGSGGDISKWPEPLGLAATFNPDVVKQFGEIASLEYRALGITTALSPQVDIATEPRWMRFNGTFGEDGELSADMAKAYCEGFQNSDEGWGSESVNAMVKHWPGGGSGEAGRDAHYAYGKYAVYPGNNFDEHLKPFTDGAFKLDKTGSASAIMPYYTISYNQTPSNVGNGFNSYLIQNLLRGEYKYDGVVCTDWNITHDNHSMSQFISGKSWGVEEKTVEERHYQSILAGVDQFGGNNDLQPVLAAYEMGKEHFSEAVMRNRFEQSAHRLLRNIFQTGLFENPYLSLVKSEETCGNPAYMQAGFEAQKKSVVLLKNKTQVLPLAKKLKVYIPERTRPETFDWFGKKIPATKQFPVDKQIIGKFYELVEEPAEADFALVFIESPQSVAYTEQAGYLPISLQYRPYTAKLARETSIAGGDPLEELTNRTYKNKTNKTTNESDLDAVLATRKLMGDKPVIVCLDSANPTVVAEFETAVDGLLVHFSATTQALLTIISGETEPSGLLPFQMPASMDVVETQKEDVGHDMEPYTDELGHVYDFAYGLDFSGVIADERVRKYKK
ncbi:glycoside hydrolase family 3 N-terminal domain-containing protein [Listeria seeligeri]|uniref:beta-glucosidase n=3 Tax=Listeria seeligeri TaxID=1640 RepID=A0A7X0X0D2_LISSE|nr:glycoside hydrolase family 3 N-terminal domain-containing protein [Listeria seeligeri]MBC1485189.1 glycoside hydrolase family 3 protein [Listeria seeligeri]MBC1595534.1 glycoside hydrolase family 3 protein [Listeria seeligeri]MBC1598213.1 glycoside hydrolase family 3 protein [Listeria seeligeri]MBF2414347.1 glycoside hydrolase family 3 C-terminal domain-containing protein [Listeria seeligeri]MBF2543678.1 glycoside hydrolase family 3 C-terminal domain-containing protein [Listeria seeligeri]